MTIHIEDLKFQSIIGILDFERVTPQDVIVNLKIEYIYEKNFINYANIVETVKNLMIKNKFLLIEDAIQTIVAELIKSYSSLVNIDIKITKPSILPECRVSVSNYYKI